MHEIPETMVAVATLVAQSAHTAHPIDEDTVIRLGLQNWIQELLDEGIEGGYLTAELDDKGLTVTDIGGQVQVHQETPTAAILVAAFKVDSHGTLMQVQTAIRRLIDTHQVG